MISTKLVLASNNTKLLLDAISYDGGMLTDIQKIVLSNAILNEAHSYDFKKIVKTAEVFSKMCFVCAFEELSIPYASLVRSLYVINAKSYEDEEIFKKSTEILYSCLIILHDFCIIKDNEFVKLTNDLNALSTISIDDIKIYKMPSLESVLQIILDEKDAKIFDDLGNLQSAGSRGLDKLYDCLSLILENADETFAEIDAILNND